MRLHLKVFRGLTCVTVAAIMLLSGCGGGQNGAVIHANPQSLQFTSSPTLTLGGTASVLAVASSHLNASYSSATPAVCSVDVNTGLVTSLTTGICTIAANQFGNDEYAPAAQIAQNLGVQVSPVQSITFGTAPALALYGTAMVSATATSGLGVTYSSSSPAICGVDANSGIVTDIGVGACVIAANQSGNASVSAAPQVSQTLTVTASGLPLTTPGAPSDVSASLGSTNNTTLVSFVGPAISGGSPITGYTVNSSPAGLIASGLTSPITVNCITSCAGYAFAVQASNGVGSGAFTTAAHVLTKYRVTARWYEPDTQPNDTIFTGTFTLDSTTQSVFNLVGQLTESMTGSPMTTVPLNFQLSALADGSGGVLVSTFALNTTNVFAEGGFNASSLGLYYGYPGAPNPSTGGAGNSFVSIYVPLANPTVALTPAQINRLAYGDCAAGGMMGDTCMTGYSGIGTMGGYPVAQSISAELH